MSSRFGHYAFHANQICCPGCGNNGSLNWEDGSGGHDRQLIRIDGDFHERLSRRAPYPIELVCNGCGTVQREAVAA